MDRSGPKREDVLRAQGRVGLRQAAVAWSLTFAQTDLGPLMTSEQDVLRLELHALVHHPPKGIASDGEYILGLFDLDLAEAQRILLGIFQRAVARQPIDNPVRFYPSRLVWWNDHYELFHQSNEGELEPAEELQAVMVRLIHRLPHGYMINACQAPRLRQQAPCGRLFLTKRAAKRYCSPACQQRAHHRRNRYPA